MNKIILGLFLIIASSLNSQEIEIGSSLKGLTNLITNETKVEKTSLGLWIENEIYFYELSQNTKLMISCNYYPFGILIENETPYFLIDIDGDSILDYQMNRLFVPHWVVSLNSKEKNNEDNINSIFEMYYQAYQNNESLRDSELIINGAREIINAGQNISYQNRDVLYIFYLYDIFYSRAEYQLCLRFLSYLDNEINSRFRKGTHVVIFIYLVETLYKLNRFEDANEINDMLLGEYPNCIPGLVYQYLLEQNLGVRDELKIKLLGNFGDHWLVKDKVK
jgi:hypothetical protein